MNKILTIYFIFLSLIISSCSAHKKYQITLKPYSNKEEGAFYEKNNLSPPYGALFKNSGREILYLAINHETSKESATFKLIDRAFEIYKPELVLIEGFEMKYGPSPRGLIEYINQTCAALWNCGENLYSAYLANKNNIPFMGAEPDNEAIYKSLQNEGYSEKDFLFFYFAQQIPQYKREGKLSSAINLPALFTEFMKDYWKTNKYNYGDFITWYEEKAGRKLSYKELINSESLAPLAGGTYLQKFSSQIGEIRDKNIINLILKSSKKYKKIMVVYGASHYFTEKDSLINFLGEPKYFSNFK